MRRDEFRKYRPRLLPDGPTAIIAAGVVVIYGAFAGIVALAPPRVGGLDPRWLEDPDPVVESMMDTRNRIHRGHAANLGEYEPPPPGMPICGDPEAALDGLGGDQIGSPGGMGKSWCVLGSSADRGSLP